MPCLDTILRKIQMYYIVVFTGVCNETYPFNTSFETINY